MWPRSGFVDPGRDGCRVPLPWSGDESPFGFSPPNSAAPWLPQPADWKDRTVQAQTGDPHSMLELYRDGLRIRRTAAALGDGAMRWLPSAAGVLAFARDPGFVCVANLSTETIDLPQHDEVLLASGQIDGDRLPPDTTAWLRTA